MGKSTGEHEGLPGERDDSGEAGRACSRNRQAELAQLGDHPAIGFFFKIGGQAGPISLTSKRRASSAFMMASSVQFLGKHFGDVLHDLADAKTHQEAVQRHDLALFDGFK